MQLSLFNLGLIDFLPAWDFQRQVWEKVRVGLLDSALIICRHRPVITLGRQAKRENILATPAHLLEKKIAVQKIERGGDITYHGPGQLTLYPVLNLKFFKKDIHWYLRALEDSAIEFLRDFNIRAETVPGLTGVWVNHEKIASIGIAIRQWISFHGISINILESDLDNYSLIRPCGMDIAMTSLESQIKRKVEIVSLANKVGDIYRRLQ